LYVCELRRRRYRAKELTPIRGPDDAYPLLKRMANFKREHFVVLLLNARHECIGLDTVSIGSLNASIVHPREVFTPAIKASAAALILAHNHPPATPNLQKRTSPSPSVSCRPEKFSVSGSLTT
jgi:DNA repair protein RadC